MPSSSASKKYRLWVVLVGVVGVAVAGMFVFLASQRISGLIDEAREVEGRGLGAWARAIIARSLQVDERSQRLGLVPVTLTDQSAVARIEPELEDTLADHPFVEGLVVRMADGRVACTASPSERASIQANLPPVPAPLLGFDVRSREKEGLTVAFRVPEGEGVADALQVNLHVAQSPLLRERRALLGFLVFSVVSILVGAYVLAATAILVNRAQIRLMQQEREKAARLRAVGQVAGGIAHEVRNPLNAISLSVQYMERLATRGPKAPGPSDFARIHVELGKIRKVVDNFVKFARIRDIVLAPMDLGDAAEEVLLRFADEMEALGIRWELVREGDLTFSGDREKLVEVLAAVVSNAVEAIRTTPGGEIRVRVAGERRWIRALIRDTGEVLDDNVVRNIFEPYFTTRDSAMGLGMTVAKTLVESHGGTIAAAPAQGGGCVVTIALPRQAVV